MREEMRFWGTDKRKEQNPPKSEDIWVIQTTVDI